MVTAPARGPKAENAESQSELRHPRPARYDAAVSEAAASTGISGDPPRRIGISGPGLAVAVALVFRVGYAWFRPLLPDEAYYWDWSRRLAAGYFDHPPGIAWLIRASTTLFGTSGPGVRALGVALMFGAIGIVLSIARQIAVDGRG